tara:strand:- start:1363 stop:2190 length:828 start_codon:yes stop_codon:yes gene_type:complete
MNKKKLSIIVFSCDAYSDLWEDFFRFMDINWENKPYECYLVNNNKYFEAKGVKVINAGNGDWSTRARIALEEITTPHVMTFLEDYFISEKIDQAMIEKALSYVESESIDYYQLCTAAKEDYPKWTHFNDKKYLYTIPKTQDYWVDTSISIWNKNFMLELLGKEDYSAWKFELDRCRDTKYPERYKNKICVLDSRNLISMSPMVIQGKFYPKSIKLMEKKGHKINISNREVLTSKEVFRYNLKRFFAGFIYGRKLLKNIGRKFGYVFMSDLYKQEK